MTTRITDDELNRAERLARDVGSVRVYSTEFDDFWDPAFALRMVEEVRRSRVVESTVALVHGGGYPNRTDRDRLNLANQRMDELRRTAERNDR
uniref:Uncharacterized protein n=1 Tax=viral metagenome TaxID=1070528 RepID=A0A6M3M5T3_9ZZZZ